MKGLRYIYLVILVCCTSLISNAASVNMQVEMPRGKRSIGVGDTFWISFTLKDVDAKLTQPNTVPGAKIKFFSQTAYRSSSSFTNGKMSHSTSITYTLTLKAEKEGSYKYGPITVDGVKSNTISYSIGKEEESNLQSNPTPSSGDNSKKGPVFIGKGDEKLFLRANVSKTNAFEQEALVYTIKLYSSYGNVKFVGAASAPTFDGFVIEDSKISTMQMDFETYNGKSYATAVIARYIIFPQVTGNLKVLGNTYTISVDAHEYYNDPDWGRMTINRPIKLNVKPNDLVINVKALPSPKPVNFSGGVGVFDISSSMSNTNLRTNHAASVVYTVSGEGNLRYIKLPDLNNCYPQQLEVYSPETSDNVSMSGSNMTGSISMDYSFMPLEVGEYDIPQVELVYFNPHTAQYETKKAKGYHINVTKGEVSEKSQTRDRIEFNAKLISPIKKANVDDLIVDSWLYWLWYIVPMLLFVAMIGIRRKHLNEMSDIELLKSKKANKVAKKRLKKAEVCLKNSDTDKFYDEMLLSIWGYLGDKLRIPISDLNRDNIRQKLSDVGISHDVSDNLISLIDECEFAKYSSQLGVADMSTVYTHGCEVIDTLEISLKNKVK